MTHVVRYEAAGELRIGVLTDGIVRAVPGVTSMAELLGRDLTGARARSSGRRTGPPSPSATSACSPRSTPSPRYGRPA